MDFPLCLKPSQPPFPPKRTQIKGDPNKDWNAIIKKQANLKSDNAVLSTYTHMQNIGLPPPDNSTLPLVLKSCAKLKAVDIGQRIHYTIEDTNLMKDVRVGTAIVDFYCRCGFPEDAYQVFDKMYERDLVLWNVIISGLSGCGCHEKAIGLFRKMQEEGLKPNSRTMVALLLACEGVLEVRLGQEIHSYCLRNGFFDLYPHVGTALIGFYLNFDMRVSILLFDLMVVKNAVSWNAMITAYFGSGHSSKALELFLRMLVDGVHIDKVTILVVIQACAEFGSLKMGLQVHQIAIKFNYNDDMFILNALLNMYSEIGSLELTHRLFDTILIRDVALWNSMIASFIDYGCYEEATSLFNRMRTEMREDERTVVMMLSICKELTDGLRKGKSLHAHACKSGVMMDISLGNALLSMYADLDCVQTAQKVFNETSDVDVISYNTLILALASSNFTSEAWALFGMMRESKIEPNSHTIISLLATCADESCINIGRSIHGFMLKCVIDVDLLLNTALIDMYMNCGDEATARSLFDACPKRDLISWNAMIAGYIKNDQTYQALALFNRMVSDVKPNEITIINILSKCTTFANLSQGQCLHAYATRRFSSFSLKVSLANAFITMYTRCGGMKNAEKIFETLPRRNIISWNAMITGYATHGLAYDAILSFNRMLEDNFQPNGVTFLSVISACRHAGLIEMGLQFFHSMFMDFKISPVIAHYGCVVDLLGRGGCLDKAREFINSMPIEPDTSVWRALLSACRDYSNTELAAECFEKLVKIEPMNAGNYILLSNIYAAAGLWPEVREIRKKLKEKGLRKPPGISWIIIRDQTHSFTAGDTLHPESTKIYANLRSLLALIRDSGYVTDVRSVFHIEED